MTEQLRSPSREFLVQQAVLNATLLEVSSPNLVPSWLKGRFRVALERPDLDWEYLSIIPLIRREFRALATRYGSAT